MINFNALPHCILILDIIVFKEKLNTAYSSNDSKEVEVAGFFPSVTPHSHCRRETCRQRYRCCCWCCRCHCRRLPAAALNFCLWNGFESSRVLFAAPCPPQSIRTPSAPVAGHFLGGNALLVIRMFDKRQSCTKTKTTQSPSISEFPYTYICMCICTCIYRFREPICACVC